VTELSFDYESYSEANLKQVGVSRYARDPSTEVLMTAFQIDDERLQQWVPAEGERMPSDLRDALRDPNVKKIAWNAAFEWNLTTHVLGIETDFREWEDTMVAAYYLSLPGKLDLAGPVVGLSDEIAKMKGGTRLIKRFTMPRKPTPRRPWKRETYKTDKVRWEEFKEYNKRDVIAEQAIRRKIKSWPVPDHEWEMWFADRDINELGVPVNLDMIDNGLEIIDTLMKVKKKELAKITGLDNPNSGEQLLPWLRDQGYPYEDLKKGHISRALEAWDERFFDDKYRKALELRQELSRSSVKKYNAFWNMTCDDGMLRNTAQFMGAGRTARWSGRGVQLQNLMRPTREFEDKEAQEKLAVAIQEMRAWEFDLKFNKPFDALGSAVRPAIQAPRGLVFLDADYNAIENRVLGWMANDSRILNVFKKNRDPYVDFAGYLYQESYDKLFAEYKAGDKSKRTVAKPGVLGCGYMLGAGKQFENERTGEIEATGLLGYAWNMGVRLTPKQSQHSVDVWRETFSDAVNFWYEFYKAAKKCIREQTTVHFEMFTFDISGPFMRLRLPSRRYLHYCRPKLEMKRTPWGEKRPTITYENLNDKNKWVRVTTHPGKLTENADQAVSRDLLAVGIRNSRRAGIDVRLHVHDQIVALEKEDRAEASLKKMVECMLDQDRWARDLPLNAVGTVSKYFIKD
jgi:DNA polymerase bacteriophage-type